MRKLNATSGQTELKQTPYLREVVNFLGDRPRQAEEADEQTRGPGFGPWWSKLEMALCGFIGAIVAIAAGRTGIFLTKFCGKMNFRTRRGFQSFSNESESSETSAAAASGSDNRGADLQELEIRAGAEGGSSTAIEEAKEAKEEDNVKTEREQ